MHCTPSSRLFRDDEGDDEVVVVRDGQVQLRRG